MKGWSTRCSLVSDIKDLLLSLKAAVSDLQLGLVERLRLVEVVTVGRPNLVSVLVLLRPPGRAVPELTIALVTTMHGVGASVCLELLGVAEDSAVVTRAVVGLVVNLGVVEAVSGCRHPVVLGLVVGSCVPHGTGAIPATSHLHCDVFLWNQFGIETGK